MGKSQIKLFHSTTDFQLQIWNRNPALKIYGKPSVVCDLLFNPLIITERDQGKFWLEDRNFGQSPRNVQKNKIVGQHNEI